MQIDIRARNIRGRQFKIVRTSEELYLEILSADYTNSYLVRLGVGLKYADSVITSPITSTGNTLAIGINRADKSSILEESYVVLLFSFTYNTTVWVKYEYPTATTDKSRLSQLILDEDNEIIYACGDLNAVYYKG